MGLKTKQILPIISIILGIFFMIAIQTITITNRQFNMIIIGLILFIIGIFFLLKNLS